MWDNTPLLIACTYGHSEVALRLIAAGANAAARNEHGATPLHYAIVEGSLRVVEALLASARGVDGEVGAAKLVNCGTARVYNRQVDAYTEHTPLGFAAESGFCDTAELLLSAGAEVESAEEGGEERHQTPLWLACRHSHLPVARLLLQRGANCSAKSAEGVSVLGAACAACHEELVLALLSHGVADVNDTAGSPLRDAVRAGKQATVEALLTNGAGLHPAEGDPNRSSPLHVACEKGSEALVTLLIRRRADPELQDAAGHTALDLLKRRGFPEAHATSLLRLPPEAPGGDGSTGATAPTQEGP